MQAQYSELKQYTLLQGFSDEELQALLETFEQISLSAGDYLFHQGDASSEIYFLRSGQVVISAQTDDGHQKLIATLHAGQEVGELSLVDGSLRSASAQALEDTKVFVMHIHRLPITLMLLSRLLNNTLLLGTNKLRQTNPQIPQNQNEHSIDIQELKTFPLFTGLSDAELDSLTNALQETRLEQGEYLFREGEQSSNIFLIRSGKVEICKTSTSGTEQIITTLDTGNGVGELALLDGRPRSASARVSEAGHALVLQTKKLPTNLILLSRLISNITLVSADKLRQINTNHVNSLERSLAAVNLKNEFGQFFIYILIIFTICIFINQLLYTYLNSINIYSNTFSWGYLSILLIPSLALVWTMKIPLNNIGVTRKNLKKSFKEGIYASIGLIGLFIILTAGLRYLSILPSHPLRLEFIDKIPLYFIHSYLQEFIARGILQSSLQRFFDDERGLKSIMLASFIFGLSHIQFGFLAVLLIFINSLIFGAFYLRTNNLLGVSIFHLCIGTFALVTGLL